MNLTDLTIESAAKFLAEGTLSSSELTEHFIQEIETKDKDINAFITTTFELARAQAKASDQRRKDGKTLGVLDGIPITLKDIISTKNVKTTAASNMLKNYIPPFSATCWEKLEALGAVLLGKTNTDEFAMGASTETSAFGVTKNPHNYEKVAGGSSGGSAASVAAGFCLGSIGTDTGGSIRQPAAFCGVVGMKPTYGRVSRFGVIPMASSFDTIGSFAKTPKDAAILLQAMAGKDSHDTTTINEPLEQQDPKTNLTGIKIGIPKEYFPENLNPEIAEKIEDTKKVLESLGAKIIEISLPQTQYAVPTYYVLVPSEVSSNMARFDGIRYGEGTPEGNYQDIIRTARAKGFGDEVKRRIFTGAYCLSAGFEDDYYKKALGVRSLIREDFDTAFETVDFLLTPTTPHTAFKIGDKSKNPVDMYREDIFICSANLAGIPAISLPSGTSSQNLPIGIQLIGNFGKDAELLTVADVIQKNR